MADRKISDLTALTAPASGDFLPIVDISEAAAATKNKRVTIQSLFQGIPVNVGIGTSSPGAKLDVVSIPINVSQSAISARFGTGNNTYDLRIQNNIDASGNPFVVIKGPDGGLMYTSFEQGGVERLRIDSSGNVGIGTSSPAALMHIYGSGGELLRIESNYGSDGYILFKNTSGSMSAGMGGAADNIYQITDRTNSHVAYQYRGGVSGYQIFAVNGSERLRIDSSGNVGIGTSTPRGQVSISNNAAGTGVVDSSLHFGYSVSDYYGFKIVNSNEPSDLAAGLLKFQRGTTVGWENALVINNNGDVSIGTTTAIARLTIEKAFEGGTAVDTNTTTASTTYSAAAFRHNGTLSGSIAVSTTATTYATSSDYRLKENVTAVTDGITRLQQLKPSRFNFISNPDKTVDGFIAHEAQAVVPECVTGAKDAVDDEGNPVYQGIDQSKLVPLLTAALQEAIGEIESLKARLTAAGI